MKGNKFTNFTSLVKIYILLCLTLVSYSAIQTCEEVEKCFINTIAPDVDKNTKICQEKTNCDDACLKDRVAFDECTSDKCTCNPNEDFKLECFNNCKLIAKNEKFKLFADCLFEPCMPVKTHKFLIFAIILIFVILGIAITGFYYYKWRKARVEDASSSNAQYSTIN